MSHHGNEMHLEQKYEYLSDTLYLFDNLLDELYLIRQDCNKRLKEYKKKLKQLEELEVYCKSNITGLKNDTN